MKTDHQNREHVYVEISEERSNQHAQWGGESHDDGHSPIEWLGFIEHQINRTKAALTIGGEGVDHYTVTRARLVKIAALAVAGIESIDRTVDVG